jgi:hypothetical protein
MSTFRNPVGPQPSSTYWRRRLMVILGLVAVIVVIVLIAVRPGSTPAATTDDDKKTNTAAPADSEAVAADPETPCAPGVVTVAAITDAGDYIAGQQPLLSLSVTNTGTTACTFAVGADVQKYTITSGTEQIWTSTDCQAAATPESRVLEPGVALATTPFAWDRTRSDPAACESTERAPVTGGGASYHLAVTINGVESAETKQFLLN